MLARWCSTTPSPCPFWARTRKSCIALLAAVRSSSRAPIPSACAPSSSPAAATLKTCWRRRSAAGVTQYVLLGAGLDTFAHRNPHPSLRVFEVDHPATQQWKRELLRAGSLPEPPRLTYVPVDFERQSLARQLHAAGFDSTAPSFFAWLGVVPYLTLDAFRATVRFIAAQPPGSGVVFDYGQPRAVLPLARAAGPRLARLASTTRRRTLPALLYS